VCRLDQTAAAPSEPKVVDRRHLAGSQ